MKFSGSNVLITGASRGIGAEIAKVLSSFDLKVWINYHKSFKNADELKNRIEDSGKRAAVIGFDASSESEYIEAISTIVESDGELSYLVNNAGITNDKLAIRMKVEEFESVIKNNLTSSFIGCKEALKVMSKKRFGSVVNISSIIAERGNAGQSNYAAAKGGMISMTKSFAQEGSPRNVRFNSITPGFINTEMTSSLKDDVKESYEKAIPLKRFGEPQDVAYGVAFLLSDYSNYITGEVLRINGGLYM